MDYKYKIIKTNTPYDGFNKLQEYYLTFEQYNGLESPTIRRELFYRKPCVGLLPYDPIRQEIILIEQIRIGLIANTINNIELQPCSPISYVSPKAPWLCELIAGIIDATEPSNKDINYNNKELAAIREAKEEANCEIKKLIPIYEYYLTPGCSNETISLYCGIVDTSEKQTGEICGLESESEDIKLHVIKLNDAFNMLKQGQIISASTIIALQWLALNYKDTKMFSA